MDMGRSGQNTCLKKNKIIDTQSKKMLSMIEKNCEKFMMNNIKRIDWEF